MKEDASISFLLFKAIIFFLRLIEFANDGRTSDEPHSKTCLGSQESGSACYLRFNVVCLCTTGPNEDPKSETQRLILL
jgi:hypothetical protein